MLFPQKSQKIAELFIVGKKEVKSSVLNNCLDLFSAIGVIKLEKII